MRVDSNQVVSTWKKKQRVAKGDMVEISGKGDKRSGMDLGWVQQMSADRQKWKSSMMALRAL